MGQLKVLAKTQLGRLYAVLCVSVLFFAAELVVSHLTHSLTLLVDAYHMLCNMLALAGCIATLKLCQRPPSVSNTFGWARLEVLAMLVDIFFLGALCFSVLVESVQTVVHADHQDAMHHPIPVGILGIVGLLVNLLCILLIGGYTHHQGSFLNLNSAGNVILQTSATEDAVRQGMRRLSSAVPAKSTEDRDQNVTVQVIESRRWPDLFACVRDISSCILVTAVSIVVYLDKDEVIALYFDPALASISVLILTAMSYPFMLQAGRILLQTIPDHINVEEMRSKILDNFAGIVNVHEMHVWALTPTKIYLTAHLLFVNKQVYAETADSINKYFQEQGITQVTVQPEFFHFGDLTPAPSRGCILTCTEDSCIARQCCSQCVKVHQPCCAEDVESAAGPAAILHDDKEQDTSQAAEPLLKSSPEIAVNNDPCMV